MKQLHCLGLLVLFALIAGCTPSVSLREANAISAASQPLLDHAVGEIPKSEWPAPVIALRPERVYRMPEGVYICTYEFFVEELGVFVLDPASSFVPERGTDPGYVLVVAGVFTYRFAG
jgi:hypothetical protein